MPSGVDDLCDEFRGKRDGRDCKFNVIINVVEARGLLGKGSTGLNECRAKVFGLWDPDGYEQSCVHSKTSTPFFGFVAKLTYEGQPRAFFQSTLVIQILHDRGLMPPKPIGQLQVGIVDIFHSRDHKVPMQWFAIADVYSEEPAVPTGYIRCSLIINSQDEPGAVQLDVPEEERARCELLEIPRIHTSISSTGVYNIIFKVYQAINLNAGSTGWCDPSIKVETALVTNATDVQHGQNPVWNQQLQIPVYEPHFRQMIEVQLLNDEVLGSVVMAHFCLSWKDVYSSQDYYAKPRWYDFYNIRKRGGLPQVLETTGATIKSGTRAVGHLVKSRGLVNLGENVSKVFKTGSGCFEEATEYCGRVLMSVEIEDREDAKAAPPSIALTDMKPKDCKLFQDIKQKIFFRFHVFAAQGLNASLAQVTLTIGRKTMATKPQAKANNGMFEFSFFEAMEMEDDYVYDDKMWPWDDADYEEGFFPSDLIDCAIPVCWLNVYKCHSITNAVGLNELNRSLIGFKKMTLRELLGIGERDKEPNPDLNCGKPIFAEQATNDNEKSNVIFNMKDSSLPSFFVPAAEQPSKSFHPANKEFSRDPTHPPWPHEKCDGRGNKHPLDPYRGMQCVELDRDGTCELGENDYPGFVWISLKMYVPSRRNCATPHRGGPPILSPFSKYNQLPIPTPANLKCTDYFGLRVHIFQAKDLPSEQKSGIANAYVEVRFMNKEMQTKVIMGSNSPTWDESLQGRNFNEIELPCLGWPGHLGEYPTDPSDYKYNPKDDEWDDELPGTDEYADRWVKNYSMLRAAPRIEVRVMEKVRGVPVMLGRCYVRPEECYHTQCDPSWRELFKGNQEMDEGHIYFSAQLVHSKDPIYKTTPVDLIPQRTNEAQMGQAIENEVPHIEQFQRSLWTAGESGYEDTVDGVAVPLAFFNRKEMPCQGIGPSALVAAAEVTMRECKVQVQILGLRNMSRKLNLTSPSLHVFVQTTEKWNADEHAYKATKDKSLPSPYEVNFKEQLQLDVLLPDDPEYAPNLEFVVMDKGDFWSFGEQQIICWGTVPLKDMYPCGEKPDEEEAAEEEEDAAAIARQEKAEKKKQFQDLVDALQRQGTLLPKEATSLAEKYKSTQGKGTEIEEAFDLYMSAPSDRAFIQRTEDYLLKAEKSAIQKAAKETEQRNKDLEEKKQNDAKKELRKKKDEEKREKARLQKEQDAQEAREKKERAAEEKRLKKEAALAEKERRKEEKRQRAEEKKRLKEEAKASKQADAAGAGPAAAKGPGSAGAGEEAGGTGMTDEEEGGDAADAPAGEEENGHTGDEGPDEGPNNTGNDTDAEGDGMQPGPGAGSDDGDPASGPQEATATPADVEIEEAAHEEEMGAHNPDEVYNGDADAGPCDGQEAGHDPNLAGQEMPTDAQYADAPGDLDAGGPSGMAGAGAGAGADDDDVDRYMQIRDEDDEEPDRQEVVDTPDGKPNAEWLVFRKHQPFMEPLEKTEEWGEHFEPTFDEIALYKGRIKDYKRREAEQVGIVKCKIKIFRKEDETLAGMAKADNTRPPDYYEVGPEDPSIADALEHMRPYRMYNIYELYPETTVEVRAYCLKAFQVTPGGFMREESEELIFYHYLQAELGDESAISNIVKSLNPNFFYVFQFKQCLLPGPSQLKIQLLDGKFNALSGSTDDTRLIGETVIDLEDRWFCKDWRDVKYKPREVRDLVNEDTLPGVSQGKLSLFIDMVDQNKAEENPIEDIQVLGKTFNSNTLHTLLAYMHAYIHRYMHAYIHAYMHTHTHTHRCWGRRSTWRSASLCGTRETRRPRITTRLMCMSGMPVSIGLVRHMNRPLLP